MKPERKTESVRPMSLRHTAAAVARNYGDKGAIVITFGGDGAIILHYHFDTGIDIVKLVTPLTGVLQP